MLSQVDVPPVDVKRLSEFGAGLMLSRIENETLIGLATPSLSAQTIATKKYKYAFITESFLDDIKLMYGEIGVKEALYEMYLSLKDTKKGLEKILF